MAWQSLDELDEDSPRIEALVDTTPGIDPWCSGPDWFLPAHDAFADNATPMLWSEPGTGAVLLAESLSPGGIPIIAGLEPMWGFTSPLLGPNLPDLAELACEHAAGVESWQFCILSGLPLSRNLATAMAQPFSALGDVRATHGIVRQIADLGSGHDTWFAARSARFRKLIRQSERQANTAGVRFSDVSADPEAYGRCLAIERQSWKGLGNDGITSPEMGNFYDAMTARLQRTGRFRATIAQLGDQDIGFIFGGVRNDRYRGLQLSYIESVHHLSVSHLLQYHTIKALVAEGVHTYDLGMDMEYKRRWADRTEPSMSLIVQRSGPRGRQRIR
jgi:CelD/BcsL family acetyltransferase involved in cellulose biosynthesis